MIATMRLNTKQFSDTIARAVRESSKTAPEVVNTKTYAVAAKAANYTQVASKDAIAKELGQLSTKLVRDRKTGMLKKGKRIYDLYVASLLVNWRRKLEGLSMISGPALEKAAKKLIAARIGSVGFIASGWIKAAKEMAGSVKGLRIALPRGIKIVGSKGAARPAVWLGIGKVIARIENSALIQSGGKFQAPGKSSNPEPIAEAGISKAMQEETASFEAYLAKKMEESMKKAGAM